MPDHPLYQRLLSGSGKRSEAVLDLFLDFITEQEIELYPAQEEAILHLFDEKNVILNTPTGSGKSLVAAALHFKSLAQGKRSVYTCPIKALVNEKFLALCRDFGPDQVGMITGDATINRDAPILCCTAEILSNFALRDGEKADIHDVIIDEFHYYSDRDRGAAWQVPLLELPQSRFLLMSATMGDADIFERYLSDLTGRETLTVQSSDRPVPLDFLYKETPLDKTLETLVAEGKAPVYIVHFTQRACAESAQSFTSINFCTKEEKAKIAEVIQDVRFSSPYGKEIRKLLRHGIGLHHAGLLPKYRILVEQLAQQGLLKIICGTDTLGVGVNVPIRTVLFTQLCKFDGEKMTLLRVRDFHQICGRAGRKGYDNEGFVVVQAPEHVIENLQRAEKAASDPKKKKKLVKKKPPERGFIPWDEGTFKRLLSAKPEPMVSQFQISHGMLLNVLSRESDGCRAMKRIIRTCHETEHSKKLLRKRTFQLFRSLLERNIIEFIPEGQRNGSPIRINIELQDDFSLNQTLSLYLIDAIPLLDRDDPEYTLNLLSLVESILENPGIILQKQLDKLKTAKMAEMKEAGIEYEERIAELEKMEYPKPNRDFIYSTFNAFASKHPWVGEENIQPKSIAREMYEGYQSFADYIRTYNLQRAEGILLRHLSSVYKVLSQTVPDSGKSEEIVEMEVYFASIIRQVDSSLLDEWERMRNPEYVSTEETPTSETPALPADITRNRKDFTVKVRNEIFHLLRALAVHDYEAVLEQLNAGPETEGVAAWTLPALEDRLAEYYADHQRIRLDPHARNPQNTAILPTEESNLWRVQQVLVDPDEHNDWALAMEVDLEASRSESRPILRLLDIAPVTDLPVSVPE